MLLLVGCFEPWWPSTLTDPSPSATAMVKSWLATIDGLSGARQTSNFQSGAITATERRVWRSRGLLAAVFSERSCIGIGASRTAVAEVLRDPNELAYRPPRTSRGFRPSSLISASDYDLDPASSKPGYEVKPANQAAPHQVACGGGGVLTCPHTTAIHVERSFGTLHDLLRDHDLLDTLEAW